MQGFNYAPGTWHHPMIALDASVTDFVCIVNERGDKKIDPNEDTEERFYKVEGGQGTPAAWVQVPVSSTSKL